MLRLLPLIVLLAAAGFAASGGDLSFSDDTAPANVLAGCQDTDNDGARMAVWDDEPDRLAAAVPAAEALAVTAIAGVAGLIFSSETTLFAIGDN